MPKGLEEDYSGDSKEKGMAAGGNSLFPLSFAQERIWLLDQLEPNSATYNVPMPTRIRGRLDEGVLCRALNEIVQRHEPLRTTIAIMDAEPVQVIASRCRLEVPLTDLSGLSRSERENKALQLVREDARKPFNLSKDLMIRAHLLRLEEEEHILAVNIHHIATDGWSSGIFYKELHSIYEAFLKGNESPLPELTIQYADFGVWQRQWLQGAVLEKQLSFWKRELAEAPALVELPSDLPRPAVQTYRGAQEEFELDKKLTAELKELSRREKCTLFMVLITAFKVLIHRYTGMTDILVGSPIANRNQKEIEGLIGFFSNTLVLRSDLSGTPTFREVLSRVREVMLNAYAQQDLPFEKLVEELQPVRDPSYSPLFQLLFSLQNTPPSVNESENLKLEPFEVDNGTTKFDLTMDLVETHRGVSGKIEYATDLFLPDTIRRMIGHWKVLLDGIVANPEERISKLPILTVAETQQLVQEWNATTREYPKQSCVQELVEAQAARTPAAVAVEFEGRKITFAELNLRANQTARRLMAAGVGVGVKVGICLERSIELVVGLLAITKAGGAYIPLDPNYPRERLNFIVEDSQLKVLLTQKSLATGWGEITSKGLKGLCIDDGSSEKESGANPGCKHSAESTAYVLYTSGSTGKPKGVQISHRALVNFLISMREEPGITEKDVWLAVTTLSFDIAGLELWLPLTTGAKILVVSSSAAMDGKRLMGLLEQASIMQATPATWRLLIEAGWKGNSKLKVLCGGEAWSEELAAQLHSRCGELWNMYGPTETTIWSAAVRVKPGEAPRIGPPIANTQLYVLDKALQVVPIGVAGELHIGGDGLSSGYWQRDELTKEKFIDDPFNPGRKLYKTGDLVCCRPGRRIEFLGRMDNQVKVRGYRIELGEIQSLLSQHPEVREAVVVVREDSPGEKRIVAYVVPREASSCNTEQLREMLKQKLPDYMVPSVVMKLQSLPMTPNRKVDQKALPTPGLEAFETKFIAPRDPLELQLAQLWEKIFGISPIGIRDNFFQLGGHSLLAVRLFTQIEKLTGKNLPLVTLFQSPTIEKLSGILREKGWESPWSSLVPIKPDGSRPPFYCVHGVGGNILEYMDLAKYMEKDQPFYGLQAAGLDGKRPWHKSVEEMAAHYIDEIRAFQPRGPYYIGGSSFGGLVAFEMARQFEMHGERVALLAFFDTYAPGYPKLLPSASGWRSKLNHQIYRAQLHWGNFKAARGAEKLTYVQVKAKRLWRSEVFRFNRMRRRWKEKMDNMFFPKAIRDAQKTGRQAACIFVPSRYSGNATLFRATGQMKGIYPDPTLGWGELVGGELTIYDTPGHHGAIVREPRARVLAEQLKDCLRKSQAAANASRGLENPGKVRKERGGDWEARDLAASNQNSVAPKMATT
jgi:amino acid adenylation domain-containing protein